MHGRMKGSCRNSGSYQGCGEGRRRGRVLDQGMLRFAVLRRLADEPRHGYDLIKLLQEQSRGVYKPSPGMIYPMLSLLEDQGYLSVTTDGNKRLYALTPQGREFLAQNLGLAVAIDERLATLGNDAVERTRSSFHALRDAVHDRLTIPGQSPELLMQLQGILDRALEEIQRLDP